jgi:hypothetical protein
MNYALYMRASLLCLGASACQKTDATPAPADQRLMGEWHWVSSVGGLAGKPTSTPASAGSPNTWVFKADSTYQEFTTQPGGAQLTETGTFSLGSVKSIYSGQPTRALTLRGKRSQTLLIQAVTTRLVLADNSPDGFEHTYER